MRHLPTTSHDNRIAPHQDVEYIVLPAGEETKDRNVWDYIHALRKRKWLVVMPVFIVFPLVTLYLIVQKPVYEATATLLIEKVSPNVIAIEEVVSPEYSSGSPDFFLTQHELIKSSLVLERVVDAFQLAEPEEAVDLPVTREVNDVKRFLGGILGKISANNAFLGSFMEGAEEKQPSYEELKQSAINQLRANLEIKPRSGTQLVDITLRGTDPQKVVQKVNKISEAYMHQNLEKKTNESKKAIAWLTQREKELKDKISKLEARLQQYKEDKKIVYLDQFANSENPIVKKIDSLQNPLISIVGEKEKLRTEIERIKSLSTEDIQNMLGSLPDNLNSLSLDSLKQAYTNLSAQQHTLSKRYGSKHPEMVRIREQIDELDDLIYLEISKKIRAMENDYQMLSSLEKAFEKRLETEREDFIQLGMDVQKYNDLKSELAIDKELLLTVSKRLAETTLTDALETNNIREVETASKSREAAPNRERSIAVMSLVASLLLGAGLAIMMEVFDKRFRSVHEAEQYLGLAFLGMVPRYRARKNKLVALYNPKASASEAYRTLRTWIRLSDQDGIKTLLITSALAGEGKSQTSGNLAISFAQLGQKVLLIDADLRRPQLHRNFNLANHKGLVDVLTQEVEWQSVVQTTSLENLQVLLTGGVPHNPTELLSSSHMKKLLSDAKSAFDLVIVDAPVALSISDVAILVPDMDGVLLVHDPAKGDRDVILEAKKLLDRAGARLLGLIFNNVSIKKQLHYRQASAYYQSNNSLFGQIGHQKSSGVFVDMRP